MAKQFVDGMIVKRNPKAPVYVICALSIKAGDFVKFIGDNQKNGWLNLDVMLGKNGKYYAQVNTYQPGQNKPQQEEESQAKLNSYAKEVETPEEINPEDIPF